MSTPRARLLALVFLLSCRSPVREPPIVARVASPPVPVVPSTPTPTADRTPETNVFDLREDAQSGPISVARPAWPKDPSPIVDVVIRLSGMDQELNQDVEIVARSGSVSRRILTRQMGSTRMGILCPEASPGGVPASSPDERLPKGQIVGFSPSRKDPEWVSWISFVIGGATTLYVARATEDTLVVQTTSRADGMCDEPSECSFTRKLAVIPIPSSARTRGRVVEVDGDGEIPFTFCPTGQ